MFDVAQLKHTYRCQSGNRINKNKKYKSDKSEKKEEKFTFYLMCIY